MKLLLTGAGAVGGYFGARLALAKRDVTFLVRETRAAQLRSNGLCVITPSERLCIEPALTFANGITGPFDAIIVAVKAYSLAQAMADFAPAVGPQTVIVPLLNGMRHLDALAGRFGRGAVLGGACIVSTTLDADGNVHMLADMQQLIFGELDGTQTPRVLALQAALAGCGFEATLSTAILQEMWEKWVALAAIGGITCLMRGNIGEIEAAGGAPSARALFEECVAVAAASGYPPTPAFTARILAHITAKGSSFTSSMYRDLTAGGRVEADEIVGDMHLRAVSLGLPVPLLAAAHANLAVYQQRQSGALQPGV